MDFVKIVSEHVDNLIKDYLAPFSHNRQYELDYSIEMYNSKLIQQFEDKVKTSDTIFWLAKKHYLTKIKFSNHNLYLYTFKYDKKMYLKVQVNKDNKNRFQLGFGHLMNCNYEDIVPLYLEIIKYLKKVEFEIQKNEKLIKIQLLTLKNQLTSLLKTCNFNYEIHEFENNLLLRIPISNKRAIQIKFYSSRFKSEMTKMSKKIEFVKNINLNMIEQTNNLKIINI